MPPSVQRAKGLRVYLSLKLAFVSTANHCVLIKQGMFETLDAIFPKGVSRVILDFEGRIYEGHLRDFVTNVYVKQYQRALGPYTRLSDIVNAKPLYKLEWYANLASVLGAANCRFLKTRTSRRHSLSYVQDCILFDYKSPKTNFSMNNVKKLLNRPRVSNLI